MYIYSNVFSKWCKGDWNSFHQNPDYNLDFQDNALSIIPVRPAYLGVANQHLAALRVKEQGDWTELSKEEIVW